MEIFGAKTPDLIMDSIEFAKELAAELEILEPLPNIDKILHALCIMNGQLIRSPVEHRSLIGAGEIFLIPDYEIEVEFMTDPEVESTKIQNTIVKAKIDSICWVGSAPTAGFGLRVFGVDFVEPKRAHTATAFIPLDYLNVHLAA